jgi:cell division protein FtsN
MARIEPGLYEPSDDVRVFDGAEDDYDDEGSRLPLLIVIALLVLAAFAGVVWLAYTQGVQRGRQDVPRVIAAETGPVKTAPVHPGGEANPYKGLKIYNNKAPVETRQAKNDALPSIITQPGEPLFSAFGPKHPASGSQAAPSPAPAASAPVRAAPAPAPAKPVQMAAPKPAPQPVRPPVHVAQAKPAPAPAPVVAKPTPAPIPAATGAYVAQIAAFKSRAEAEAGWDNFKRKHPATLGNMSPNIVSVDLGEKGTWFRLRTGAFADKAAAADFCSRLKAEGASCLPAKG